MTKTQAEALLRLIRAAARRAHRSSKDEYALAGPGKGCER